MCFGLGWGWGFMWIVPLFLVVLVVAVYFLFASGKDHYSHSHRTYRSNRNVEGRAVEILNERYAKGEITKEQFKEMRRELD